MGFPDKILAFFLTQFSTIRSPNLVLKPLKSASPGNAFEKVEQAFQNLRLGWVNQNAMIAIFIL